MEYSRGNLWDDQTKTNKDDLLIFGYSCKLFRDDERAVYIDQGKHLIPWMNDSNLQIDRFDVRGALYDLTEAESKGRPVTEGMTEAELKEEHICEQERYYALYHDETQLQAYQEEEAKRLQVELATDGSYYSQVGFDYNYPYQEGAYGQAYQQDAYQDGQFYETQESVSYNPTVDDDIYVPPPELNVPTGMDVPQTVKQNKIIIKTAKFIVTQGAQMEIVIKTKQAGNPMFNFLSFDHILNAYYKHVVYMIRMGKYKCDDDLEADTSKEEDARYLHPNLSQSVRPDLTPGVTSSPARPSPHCSYSNLITKIREKQKASGVEDPELSSPAAPSSPVVHSTSAAAAKVAADPQVQQAPPTPRQSMEPVVGLVDYPSFNQTADGSSDMEDSEPVPKKISNKSGVFRLYTHDYSKIKWPPPQVQMVIDKMASYITKNGSAFEEVVRTRDDARFEFLKPTDEYHAYYQCKLQLYSEVYGDIFKSANKPTEGRKKSSSLSSSPNKDSTRLPSSATSNSNSNSTRAICFSIRSREQEVPLSNNTTFPIESSTSEEDEDDLSEGEKERKRMEKERRRHRDQEEKEEANKREKFRKEEEKRKKGGRGTDEESSGNEDLYDIFKYAQEMEREKATCVRQPQQRHQRSSAPAQTKQLERKKKAAAFLSKLKGGGAGGKKEKVPQVEVYGPSLPSGVGVQSPQIASPLSRSSSEDSKGSNPHMPPKGAENPPPPPRRSQSRLGMVEALLLASKESPDRFGLSQTESSIGPKYSQTKETLTSAFLSGLNEDSSKMPREDRASESREARSRKSRSHKKSRGRSGSRSPRREKKKRKRSHTRNHRRKKRRSRSRSRSRGHSKSHRSSHQRKKEKSKRKRHKKQRSPFSSASSLPSSGSSSPSAASTLPSDSDSDMDVQVLDSPVEANGAGSGGSSVVSLPSGPLSETSSLKAGSSKLSTILEGGSDEGGVSATSLQKPPAGGDETTNSSLEPPSEVGDKKTPFNPNTSNAMAKITQGLRAKLQALLDKDK